MPPLPINWKQTGTVTDSGFLSVFSSVCAELLESFLDAGLWDEVWVETAPVALGAGVKAPVVSGVLVGSEQRRGHLLETWKRKV